MVKLNRQQRIRELERRFEGVVPNNAQVTKGPYNTSHLSSERMLAAAQELLGEFERYEDVASQNDWRVKRLRGFIESEGEKAGLGYAVAPIAQLHSIADRCRAFIRWETRQAISGARSAIDRRFDEAETQIQSAVYRALGLKVPEQEKSMLEGLVLAFMPTKGKHVGIILPSYLILLEDHNFQEENPILVTPSINSMSDRYSDPPSRLMDIGAKYLSPLKGHNFQEENPILVTPSIKIMSDRYSDSAKIQLRNIIGNWSKESPLNFQNCRTDGDAPITFTNSTYGKIEKLTSAYTSSKISLPKINFSIPLQ